MTEYAFLDQYLKEHRKWVLEDFADDERKEILDPLPVAYKAPEILKALEALGLSTETVWSHQALALEALAQGKSVGSTTPTASGKSLAFQLSSLKKMLDDANSTVLTFFPVKALNSDQSGYWETAYEAAGVQDTLVKMDGNNPLDTREDLFKDARTLITTPDFFHAWFMREMKNPKHQDFIKHLSQVNIDEAHLYDGYFGTTFSFMMRRVRALRNMLRERDGLPKQDLQIVAASATMEDPQSFLHQLAGTSKGKGLVAIGPEQCGSPSAERRIMRVDADKRTHLTSSVDTVLELLRNDPDEKVILFMDSRKGVEEKTLQINRYINGRAADFPGLNLGAQDICLPYRSGYSGEDRERIERQFKDPKNPSRVLVSTSASEVGINIPGVKYVVNAGIPVQQSSIVQRGGRLRGGGLVIYVGQHDEPNVIQNAFQTRPKDPTLHRTHEAAQFQGAMCLIDEIRAAGFEPENVEPKKHATWPKGFIGHYESVVNESPLPEHLEAMRGMGKKLPQLKFSLRTSDGEPRRVITFRKDKFVTLERLSPSVFMKEAHPGAVFIQRGRSYRIGAETDAGNFVAKREESRSKTYPMLKSGVSVYLNKGSVPEIKCDPDTGDFIASVDMQVTNTLLGFTETTFEGEEIPHFYGPESKYAKSSIKLPQKLKGFVMKFQDLEGESNEDLRRMLAREFRRIVCGHYDLSQADLQVGATNLTIGYNGFSRFSGEDSLVVYDRSSSFMGMSHLLTSRFGKACTIIEKRTKSKRLKELTGHLKDWSKKLVNAELPNFPDAARIHLPEEAPEGFAHALYNGSIVRTEEKDRPTYYAKVHGVKTYAGQVLYDVEEVSVGRYRRTQSSQHGSVTRAIPANKINVLPKQYHLWSMVDLQTGEYVSPDAYGEAPKLQGLV